jgi:hypothetical protein
VSAAEKIPDVLRWIERKHPVGRIQVGSVTHGGPPQYAEGCEHHGSHCPWLAEAELLRELSAEIAQLRGEKNLDPKPYVSEKGVRYAVGGLSFSPEPPLFLPRTEYTQDIAAYEGANLHLDPRPWVNLAGGRVVAVFSQEQVDAGWWTFQPRAGYEQTPEAYA